MKIGLVGCGAIGKELAGFIVKELKGKASLFAVSDVDVSAAERVSASFKLKPKVLTVEKLAQQSQLIVEAASQVAAKNVLELGVKYKKDVFILSVGALIGADKVIKAAQKAGIKIYVPSGAICGVDGLGALSLGGIKRISLVTSKPPVGLAGVDYIKKQGINLNKLKKPVVVFEGNVTDAIKNFPQNINVAATIMTAAGFKDVSVRIKADPSLKRNVHRIEVEAKHARLNIEVENVPSVNNPKTSALAILSAQSLLKKIFSPIIIGS